MGISGDPPGDRLGGLPRRLVADAHGGAQRGARGVGIGVRLRGVDDGQRAVGADLGADRRDVGEPDGVVDHVVLAARGCRRAR